MLETVRAALVDIMSLTGISPVSLILVEDNLKMMVIVLCQCLHL